MKKTLALFLALITVLSVALVACKKKTPSVSSDDGEDDGQYVSLGDVTTGTGSDTSDTSKAGASWTDLTDKKVYLMADEVNVRDDSTTKGKKLGVANMGDSFDAIATNGDWYKISYDGGEAYISATYVTTNSADATFNDYAEAEYKTLIVDQHGANQNAYNVNLRTFPSLDEIFEVVTRETTEGGQLVKIGENQSGNIWKVKYTKDGVSTVCYIGRAAFVNFDEKINDYGNTDSSRG